MRELAQGTPYVVSGTERGFDVTLDLADARWHSLLQRHGLSLVFTHEVTVDEATRTISITDDERQLGWRTGVDAAGGALTPTLGVSASRRRGRLQGKGFHKAFTVGEHGHLDKVVDFTFDAAEGRSLVRRAAREQGWDERAGTAQRVGLAFALLGGIGALVVLVVLLVVWWAGGF